LLADTSFSLAFFGVFGNFGIGFLSRGYKTGQGSIAVLGGDAALT